MVSTPFNKRNLIADAAIRGQWQLIMGALGTIETLYPWKVYQYFVSCALMPLIPRRPTMNAAGSSLFKKLVGLLADTHMSIIDGCFGTENNNLLHYALSSEYAAILVQDDFRSFSSPKNGKLLYTGWLLS